MILQTTGLTGTVRRGCRPIRRAGRLATAPLRELPTFIIIGVQKGGTSSLFEWIQSSPDVVPPASKEVHYFTRHYHCQFGWYKSYFPLRSLMRGRITGEATPYMLFHRDAPGVRLRPFPSAALSFSCGTQWTVLGHTIGTRNGKAGRPSVLKKQSRSRLNGSPRMIGGTSISLTYHVDCTRSNWSGG